MVVGQGPAVVRVGLNIFFSCLSFLCSFSLSLGDYLMQTETLSERAEKPTTTNQPSNQTYVTAIGMVMLQHAFVHV